MVEESKSLVGGGPPGPNGGYGPAFNKVFSIQYSITFKNFKQTLQIFIVRVLLYFKIQYSIECYYIYFSNSIKINKYQLIILNII